jgi:CheY-like chemotaxis protein
MMMVCASPEILESQRIPSVVVVDPRFDEYKSLATSARQGRLHIHFRSSGSEAMKLAKRLDIDAWLIAADLEDMSGRDLVTLLDRQRSGDMKLVEVGPALPHRNARAEAARATAVDGTLTHPISIADLEQLLGLSVEERAKAFDLPAMQRAIVTLPVGVGAAGLAIAILMMG